MATEDFRVYPPIHQTVLFSMVVLLLSCKPFTADKRVENNSSSTSESKNFLRASPRGCYRGPNGWIESPYQTVTRDGLTYADFGHIRIPQQELVEDCRKAETSGLQLAGVSHLGKMWPGCKIPYEYDPTLTDQAIKDLNSGLRDFVTGVSQAIPVTKCSIMDNLVDFKKIMDNAMRHWAYDREKRPTGMIFHKARPDDLYKLIISIDPEESNAAGYVRSLGRNDGPTRLFMAAGSNCSGVAEHELGHVIGFPHEQTRPDRDDYIKVHWENIVKTAKLQFAIRSEYNTRILSPYDTGSIMHYSSFGYSISGGTLGLFAPTMTTKAGGLISITELPSELDYQGVRELCKVTKEFFVEHQKLVLDHFKFVFQPLPQVTFKGDLMATVYRYEVKTQDGRLCESARVHETNIKLPIFSLDKGSPQFCRQLDSFELVVTPCVLSTLSEKGYGGSIEAMLGGSQPGQDIQCGPGKKINYTLPTELPDTQEYTQARITQRLRQLERDLVLGEISNLARDLATCGRGDPGQVNAAVERSLIENGWVESDGKTLSISPREIMAALSPEQPRFSKTALALQKQICTAHPNLFFWANHSEEGEAARGECYPNWDLIVKQCEQSGGVWRSDRCNLTTALCKKIGGVWNENTTQPFCKMNEQSYDNYLAIYQGWIIRTPSDESQYSEFLACAWSSGTPQQKQDGTLDCSIAEEDSSHYNSLKTLDPCWYRYRLLG